MVSRMEKYNNTDKPTFSRSKKNEQLYKELYTNKVYTEFTDIENDNVVDLGSISNNDSVGKREIYQRNRLLSRNDEVKEDSHTSYHSNIIDTDLESKNYNINDILEEAKKNRLEDDEVEKKRRLKNVEYNILADLSSEKIKEYKENKVSKTSLSKDEEENLEELIHTITSNSLRKKIDDNLLNDLLPDNDSESIVSEKLLEEINENKDKIVESNNIDDEEESGIDKSFYTKSMDLSEEDFDQELDEDDLSFIENKKTNPIQVILIILFILLVTGIVGYIVYRFI